MPAISSFQQHEPSLAAGILLTGMRLTILASSKYYSSQNSVNKWMKQNAVVSAM
jgi:hypothetical protein